MAIENLTHTLLPPAGIRRISDDLWGKAERELGTALPYDYKAFISLYGLGFIIDFIGIFSPFTYDVHANLISQASARLAGLRQTKAFGEFCPYPLFPQPGGLLPFGCTSNADVLYWLTAGPPDEWHVVVSNPRDGDHYDLHHCGMTTFLAEIISGRRHSEVFPDDLLTEPSFKPLNRPADPSS